MQTTYEELPSCKYQILCVQYSYNTVNFTVHEIPSNVAFLKQYYGDYPRRAKNHLTTSPSKVYTFKNVKEFVEYAKDAYLIIGFHLSKILREHKKLIELYEPKLKVIDIKILLHLLGTHISDTDAENLDSFQYKDVVFTQDMPLGVLFDSSITLLNAVHQTKQMAVLCEVEMPLSSVLYNIESNQIPYSNNLNNQSKLHKYIDNNTNRISCKISQASSSAGRLQTYAPNIQGLPKKDRCEIVASQGNVLFSFDYSQAELRIIAHYTKDPAILSSFDTTKEDCKSSLLEAMPYWLYDSDEINDETIALGKQLLYSVLYGMSASGLSAKYKVSELRARKFIKKIEEKFAQAMLYKNDLYKSFKANNCIRTLSGRLIFPKKKIYPNLTSKNPYPKAATVFNNLIQATCADILKTAMLNIYKDEQLRVLGTKMLVPIHDEILFETPLQNFAVAKEIIKNHMENVNLFGKSFYIPMKVKCKVGDKWSEMMSVK